MAYRFAYGDAVKPRWGVVAPRGGGEGGVTRGEALRGGVRGVGVRTAGAREKAPYECPVLAEKSRARATRSRVRGQGQRGCYRR